MTHAPPEGLAQAQKKLAMPAFPETIRLTPAASGYLDAIRALAAFAVLFGHLRGFYFVDFGHIDAAQTTRFVKAIYAVTGFGHQAVMVFFVLSGFLISSSILRNFRNQTWSWSKYASDRGSRLYVVLIPGLLLGLAWDWAGITFFNHSGIYSAPLLPFGDRVTIDTLTPSSFIGNLLFLQTRFTPVFGSNGPLWSLFNEFWYYLLFPALILLILSARRRAPGATAGYFLLAAFTVWILGNQLNGFYVWLSGCAVATALRYLRFPDSARLLAALYASGAAAVFCASLVAAHAGNPWLGSDLTVGFSFAFLVYGVLQLDIPIGRSGLMLAKTFAGFSYSLYVLHFPMLYFIRAKWLPESRWQPDMRHLAYGLGIGACVIVYAFAVSRITESNTPAVRAWVRNKIAI